MGGVGLEERFCQSLRENSDLTGESGNACPNSAVAWLKGRLSEAVIDWSQLSLCGYCGEEIQQSFVKTKSKKLLGDPGRLKGSGEEEEEKQCKTDESVDFLFLISLLISNFLLLNVGLSKSK